MDATYAIVKVYVTERNDVINAKNHNMADVSKIVVTGLLKKSTFWNERCARTRIYRGCEGYIEKNPFLAITVWHHEASHVMPDSDPLDGFFYIPLTPMIDTYIL